MYIANRPAYPGFLGPAATEGIKCIGVQMDSDGILATALEEILGSWDESARGAKKPKAVIMVP
jgi:aromatic amino acid aminotransferase I